MLEPHLDKGERPAVGWGNAAHLRAPPRSRCRAWAENAYSEGTTHGDESNGFFRRGATRVAAAGAPLVHSRFAQAVNCNALMKRKSGCKGAGMDSADGDMVQPSTGVVFHLFRRLGSGEGKVQGAQVPVLFCKKPEGGAFAGTGRRLHLQGISGAHVRA